MDIKKTILITGFTGFLGSHFLRSILNENLYNVVCLKRSFSNMARLAGLNLENVKIYNVDLVDEEIAFEENNIDVIIHMATEYGRKGITIFQVLSANLMYPLKIAELGIKYNVKSFINTDSFFNKECYSHNYLLSYSLSKKSLLSYLKILAEKMFVVNVILEHLYGEYDNETKFVEFVIRTVGIEKKAEIDLTHGHQRRDFVYIDDVVNAFALILKYAITEKIHFKTFEVGCGNAIEIRTFVDKVKEMSNSGTRLNYGRIPYRSDEIIESKADVQELTNLGWKPKYNIEDGINKILMTYSNDKFGD